MANQKSKDYTIGIDIGGTKIAAVLFDGKNVIEDYSLATPRDTLDRFIIMLKAVVDPLLERAKEDKKKVVAIGMGVPATVDTSRKRALVAPNLRIIEGIDLASRFESFVNIPVIMDNDVNCFLRGEMTMGVGTKYQNVYGITIGTGIGGAWWNVDDIYAGAHGGASDPGAMIVDYAEGVGLEEAYHKLTQNNPASMAEEAYRGDVLAEKTFNEVGEMLGVALANIVNILDPELIVIGGGVAESEGLFLPRARKTMREYIQSPEAKKRIKIVKAKLGKQAGAIGAALMR